MTKAADPYHDRRWPRTRLLILQRDGYLCKINGPKCKGTADTVDHIIPWSTGGSWFDHHNLRAACGPCNYGRTRLAVVDRREVGPSREW